MNAVVFNPNWISPPSETIYQVLEEREIALDWLVDRGVASTQEVKEIQEGTIHISEDFARRLEGALEIPISFWLERQKQFIVDIEKSKQLDSMVVARWVKKFPVSALERLQWLTPRNSSLEEKAQALLTFFGVENLVEWNFKHSQLHSLTSLRTSKTFSSSEHALSAWLRKGELEANDYDLAPWNRNQFECKLPEIRGLCTQKDPSKFLPQLIDLCAQCGVAVVILKAPPGCKASGATWFFNKKPIILLSFRYLSDDHFWFSFFHEVGHILLHSHKKMIIERDKAANNPAEQEELEADTFAQNILIPLEEQIKFQSQKFNEWALARTAKRLGISPGILVGQLQSFGLLKQNHYNKFKIRYQWGDEGKHIELINRSK